MTNEFKEQVLGERVRALATIVLTRRGDLSVVETKKDTGLDFHVYIDREDKPMRLMFGVLLRGVPSAVTLDQADKILGPTLGQFQGMRKFTYPVCLFFFTMREEQAFFSWLAEPVVNCRRAEAGPSREGSLRRADERVSRSSRRGDRVVVRFGGGGADCVACDDAGVAFFRPSIGQGRSGSHVVRDDHGASWA